MKSDPESFRRHTSTLEGSSSFGIIGAVADWPGIACGAAASSALPPAPLHPRPRLQEFTPIHESFCHGQDVL